MWNISAAFNKLAAAAARPNCVLHSRSSLRYPRRRVRARPIRRARRLRRQRRILEFRRGSAAGWIRNEWTRGFIPISWNKAISNQLNLGVSDTHFDDKIGQPKLRVRSNSFQWVQCVIIWPCTCVRACITGNSCLENDCPDEKLRIYLGAARWFLLFSSSKLSGETLQRDKLPFLFETPWHRYLPNHLGNSPSVVCKTVLKVCTAHISVKLKTRCHKIGRWLISSGTDRNKGEC